MKTTVVKGVLTSYELVLAILFRWRAQSCVRNIVWLWRSHVSGLGLDHHTLATRYCAIAHLPTFELLSFYLLSIRRHCPCCCFVVVVIFVIVLSLPSLFCALFPPLEMRSTLCVYACIVVSIGKEGYQSLSALAVTCVLWKWWSTVWYSWVADGQMMFGSLVDQGIAHPWSSYGLKMLQLCGRHWWCSRLWLGVFISRGRHPGAPVDLFFNAEPPQCCPLLFCVGGHRCAVLMSAGNNKAWKMLTLEI
jgi:hypothetical protein